MFGGASESEDLDAVRDQVRGAPNINAPVVRAPNAEGSANVAAPGLSDTIRQRGPN